MAIITLTTDFGTADGYVGAMKGVILAHAPDARIVDIAHDIPRHDIAAGAFALAQAAPQFPDGTIHLAVVDPGVGGSRAAVIVSDGRQLFIGPDNGLLSLVAPTPLAVRVIADSSFRRPWTSATFHGRDVFAVAAGRIAAGTDWTMAGPPIELSGCLTLPQAAAPEGAHCATVIHVDNFGNLITDMGPEQLPDEPRFRIGENVIERLCERFENVATGELVAYIGSGNTLEIAVREGDASQRLGTTRGGRVEILEAGAS